MIDDSLTHALESLEPSKNQSYQSQAFMLEKTSVLWPRP